MIKLKDMVIDIDYRVVIPSSNDFFEVNMLLRRETSYGGCIKLNTSPGWWETLFPREYNSYRRVRVRPVKDSVLEKHNQLREKLLSVKRDLEVISKLIEQAID